MKKLFPFHVMAESFRLVSMSLRPKLGRKSNFTPEGKVALMFLKIYGSELSEVDGVVERQHPLPDVLTIEVVDNYQTGKGDYKVCISF